LRSLVLDRLSESASYVSELGREFEGEFDHPKIKTQIWSLLKNDLCPSGVVVRLPVKNRHNNELVLYALKKKGEGLLHRSLVSMAEPVVSSVCASCVRGDPHSGSDLIGSDAESGVAIEVETGLKENLETFVEKQIPDRLENYNHVVVVVPNEDQRTRFASELASLPVPVVLMPDLEETLERWF